jgi:pimeloyl-ACP methyl ester carboxylesterase
MARLLPAALLAPLLLLGGTAAAEGPAAPDLKAMEALAAEWFQAPEGQARLDVEEKARAFPPIPEDAVKPLSEKLFALAKKNGLRLSLKTRATLYPPPKDKKPKDVKEPELGLYLVAGPKPKGGLLIAMHGGGENQGDADSAMGQFGGATAFGLTVISPQAYPLVGSAWNEPGMERFIVDLIDAARRTLDVDPDRVYLAGHSMGGDGSWMLGGRHADRLAGAAPLAGSVMPYMKAGKLNRRETPLSDYESLSEGVLPNIMHLPYWIYHSDDDLNEAVHPDDIAVGFLKKLQAKFPGMYPFHYDRVTGMAHALPKGGVKPILKFLTDHERTAYPDEVAWETCLAWKDQMYWLHSRGHRAGWVWRWHAKIVEPNHVEVTGTTSLRGSSTTPTDLGLTLLLSPKLFDFSKPLKVTSRGAVLFEGPVTRSFWAMLVSIAPRNDPGLWFEGHVSVKVPRGRWWDFWDDDPNVPEKK